MQKDLPEKDPWAREFRTLRVSLTQACNFACSYCVFPSEKLSKHPKELAFEDLIRLVQLVVHTAGIQKIRITGGEPLLHHHFLDIAKAFAQLPVPSIGLTTNGTYLTRFAAHFRACRILSVNVSLDSLDPKLFRDLSQFGSLSKTLEGVESLLKEGIKVKINCVVMRSKNFHSLLPLLDFALEKGVECRFLELMQMGPIDAKSFAEDFVGLEEILTLVSSQYSVQKMETKPNATALSFWVEGKTNFKTGSFGVIANVSKPFCSGCDRLRVTSLGEMYGCLSSLKNFPIHQLLVLEKELAEPILKKILGQALQTKQSVKFLGAKTSMKYLGG